MKSYIVRERQDGSRYFDENTPAGNITPEIAGDGLTFSGGKLNVDGTDLVHKSGDESIAGAKTFVASPLVPTVPDVEDASTKTANTAFVQGALSPVKTDVETIKDHLSGLRVAKRNMTFYVRKTGNDNNDGLSEGTAFLTVERALRELYNYLWGLYEPSVNVGAGTFEVGNFLVPLGFSFKETTSQAAPNLVGAGKGITIIQYTGSINLAFQLFGRWDFENLTFRAPSCGSVVYARAGSNCSITNVEIKGVASRQLLVTFGGTITVGAGCSITAENSSGALLGATEYGVIHSESYPIALSGTVTDATIHCYRAGLVRVNGGLTGSVTGKRYITANNSIIYTGGGGANFVPGTIDGTASTGGLYI